MCGFFNYKTEIIFMVICAKEQNKMIKKRILFFINTLSCGGAEKVLVDLVNCLVDKYDITVISILGGANEKRLSNHVKYHKIVKIKKSVFRNGKPMREQKNKIEMEESK